VASIGLRSRRAAISAGASAADWLVLMAVIVAHRAGVPAHARR
jgi:hypothetical protein